MPPEQIFFFGDSITLADNDGERCGWPGRLCRWLEIAGNAVTAYNLGLAVATVVGAACGGLLLRALGETPQAYAAVFAASSLLRALALPLLRQVRKPA